MDRWGIFSAQNAEIRATPDPRGRRPAGSCRLGDQARSRAVSAAATSSAAAAASVGAWKLSPIR